MTDDEKLRLVRNAFTLKLEEMETPAQMLNLINAMNPTSIKAFIKNSIQNSASGNTQQAADFTTEATEKNDYADSF